MRDFIENHIAAFERIIRTLGGRWEQTVIDDPASDTELAEIEERLGMPIPKTLRDFAGSVSRKIYFDWSLPEHFVLPDNLDEIFGGGIDFDISKLPDHERGRAGWQTECFPNPDDSYDVIWHNKVGFHHVPNGDYLGINSDGHIIYLSHDDGEGHGYTIAHSISDLLTRWLPIGCPGPEDWQWLPFVADTNSGIDPKSESSIAWMAAINKKPWVQDGGGQPASL